MTDSTGRIHLWIIDTVAGAVTSLTYYNRKLYSGHADGSIKVWDIKGQEATLVRDLREHKKMTTGPSDRYTICKSVTKNDGEETPLLPPTNLNAVSFLDLDTMN